MRFARPLPLVAAVLGVAFGASGCGNSTAPNTVTMTQAEVSELFTEMTSALSGTGLSLSRMPAGVAGPARAASNAEESISITADCGLGGTVGVSGSVNPSNSGASFNVTETASACQTEHFTVGGSITINGSAATTSSAATFNETIKGSFDVTRKSDGTSGTCAVDFSVNGNVSLTGGSSTVTASGTICGINASAVVTN
jgi:hypothetical protein